jgi:hypothetical protein
MFPILGSAEKDRAVVERPIERAVSTKPFVGVKIEE